MHKNKLLSLLARNARKGEFRAEGNVIYLYDMIVATDEEAEWMGGVSAERFVTTVRGLTGTLHLRINCPGGDVFAAQAMCQAIREYGSPVIAHVDGYAASAASVVAAACGQTLMAAGGMIMIHKAWTIAMGNADEFAATVALLNKVDGTIAEGYVASAAKRGKEGTDFVELMKAETWFTAAEAVEIGLADEIAADAPKAKARWDLTAYEHAPEPQEDPEPPQTEPLPEPANKIEQDRPKLASDLLLRPAA